jgi:hypothetical protein
MASHSCAPYRGYGIDIHVSPDTAGTLGSHVAGYVLRWRVSSPGAPNEELVSFAEQYVFISEFDALTFGEARAHTFIDYVASCPSSTSSLPERSAADR